MSTSRDRVRQALSHQGSDRIPVDFGATAVTGIHCRVVEALRKHYGLSYKPVKIVDTFQGFGRRNGSGLYWSRRYKRYL